MLSLLPSLSTPLWALNSTSHNQSDCLRSKIYLSTTFSWLVTSMELIVITLTLCVSLSVLLTPSASQQIHVQSSYHTIPRKLRLLEEVRTSTSTFVLILESYGRSHSRGIFYVTGRVPGKQHRKESGMVRGRGSGTMQEWKEGIDPSHFFTMDYSHVTRRRPIHNKLLPVAP
ncbi:hypothetical protein RHSIM_Rhsim09G0122000 [Rhododendron simsii]|uniref:Uncharacterized protein n=1 Tax=Rhododendron simsii TaxID=118357 RepID=A0A834GHJ8_RHOSS|nr:hypothetical protein RHSIM_Rhsim09G0122000 [Rhododendron simsii]